MSPSTLAVNFHFDKKNIEKNVNDNYKFRKLFWKFQFDHRVFFFSSKVSIPNFSNLSRNL